MRFNPLVRARLASLGEEGTAWAAGLPRLLAGLAEQWGLELGWPLPGGSASHVTTATTRDGERRVVKVGLPGHDLAAEARTPLAADSRGYVRCHAVDYEHGNGTKAAIAAGYSANLNSAAVQAHENLRKPKIAQALAQKLTEAGETEAHIVAGLRAREEEAAAAGQFGPAVRALELRGRHLGMWEAKAPTGTGKVIVNIFDSSATVETDGESVRVSGNDERVIEGETV